MSSERKEQLLDQLQKNIGRVEDLLTERRDIVQAIAELGSEFKVGDRVTTGWRNGRKQAPPEIFEIELITGRLDKYFQPASVDVLYHGRKVLKSGELGKLRATINEFGHRPLRLATPEDSAAGSAK